MIIGLGIDILELDHLRKILSFQAESFLNYTFTPQELEYFYNKRGLEHLATTFTAKEAFIKAVPISQSFCLKEIEVLREESGKPRINLAGNLAKQFPEDKFRFLLTSSFTQSIAVSVVIIEQNY